MPRIVVFGRRWAVGSDDFVFPAAAEILLRAAWLTALAIVLGIHSDDLSNCTNGYLVKTYYIGMVIILPIANILNCTLMYFSMQGTITNDEPRQRVPSLIILKLILFAVDIIWTGIGTYWAFSQHIDNCSHTVVIVVKGATIVGWIMQFFMIVGLWLVFDPLGHLAETPDQVQRLWKLRCKLLCCCCCVGVNNGNESNAFEDVARIIAEHLAGVNFVVTDVAAAMILVRKQQNRELQQRLRSGATMNRISYTSAIMGGGSQDSTCCPKDWMSIASAGAFMKYALASYGWTFFVYDNQCSGPFRLWFKCKCCFCFRPSDNIHGDNCCGCNTSAILEQTHIKREDIFYANFHNRLYEIPFYIVMDHETKSVIVSVRGTLSFEDVLTDMCADAEQMSVEGVPEAKAHKGILQAAKYIERMITQYHLLDQAFSKAPDYGLVVVGHSLGAGSAAILAILLKPKYPNLKCFAYSPPGWLLSLPLTRYAEEFVCSVVVGKDLVPRLGMVTLQKLKAKMINVVAHSNKPKYRILAGGVWRTIFRCREDIEDDEEHDVETDSHTDTVSTQPLLSGSATAERRSYTEEQPDRESHRSQPVDQDQLYMPGLVLFLEETQPQSGLFETPTYEAYWMKPESFDEILVCGMTMLYDHMPNVVYKALNSMIPQSITQTNVVI